MKNQITHASTRKKISCTSSKKNYHFPQNHHFPRCDSSKWNIVLVEMHYLDVMKDSLVLSVRLFLPVLTHARTYLPLNRSLARLLARPLRLMLACILCRHFLSFIHFIFFGNAEKFSILFFDSVPVSGDRSSRL